MVLSAVIITYNEEKNIERCLESLQTVADEIVVIDSLSTDKTKQICQSFNVQFIEQKFLGYIEQKNFAIAQTKYDFILSLDADEALSNTLKESILQQKQNGFEYNAYSMNRCTNFCGKWIKHGTWYPDKKIRLINKQKGKWGGVNPHDKLEMQSGSSVQHLKGDLLHYSYYALEEVITQNNKFTTIQAQAMLQQGKKASWVKLFINPLVAFINGYIFKLGFLDGADGFFIASSVAYQTMVKYAKLMKLQQQKYK
ncbi:MAG: glycosyltransferase family 2 protein [Bacteroidetes bacterium]|nr:glycosyltransferase family 2 protein [Bacteroidota bacterium]MBS1648470.1 glycosyltransferase family 2 protein [Bacteroidota bacterium]